VHNASNPGAHKDAPEPRRREQERLDLIRRVADGNQEALGELYDAASRQVYGLALRILSDASAAEEVTLEVFTQVWKTASTYDLRRGAPSAWLLTLARSRAIDRLRSGAQERRRAEPLESVEATARSSESSPETNAADAERAAMIRDALAGLPPEQRQVVELAYFGGLSHSEIAARLDQPLGTVKTRIRIAMTYLRDALSTLREDAI
jgi:RNA polymerase sigma-70 factor (ECF subfamily)